MRCSCCNCIQTDEEVQLYEDLCAECWHVVINTLDELENGDEDENTGIYTDPSSLYYQEVQNHD